MNTPHFTSRHPARPGPKPGQPDPDLTKFLDECAATIVEMFRLSKAGDSAAAIHKSEVVMQELNVYADRIFANELGDDTFLLDKSKKEHFKQGIERQLLSPDFFNSVFSDVWPSNAPLPADYVLTPETRRIMHRRIKDIVHGQAQIALGHMYVPSQTTVSLEQEPNVADETAAPDRALADQEALAIQEAISSLKFYSTPIGESIRAYVRGVNLKLADAASVADKAVNSAIRLSKLEESEAAAAAGYATIDELKQDVRAYIDQAKRL